MSDDRLRELAEVARYAEKRAGPQAARAIAKFHDAADPATILRLLDERDELRRRCEIQQTELETLRRPSRYGGEGGLVTIDLRGDDER